ncbi:hypothetical protein OG871_02000 [Kitasatospora sp. NBC_00374]|uniref:hypothetical protein n=1 Tax=Kitasatospora sp. NBC_00374 TaxID=2975964 RepID=UPI0030E24D30
MPLIQPVGDSLFNPHPLTTPRTTWERLRLPKTDSGRPLLVANLAFHVLIAAVLGFAALTGPGSILYSAGAVSAVTGAVRTGYIMRFVARGETGVTADGEVIVADSDPSSRPRTF